MGILNQQLIQAGNENLSDAARKPFSGKAEDTTVEIGYSGYLYSKDAEQQEMFDNTAANHRMGPKNNDLLFAGMGSFQYGPVGSARLSNEAGESTMLGQMAEMLKLQEDGDNVNWSNGNGQKIARSFTSGAGTRSLLDQTTNGYGTPNSSGGAVAGYNAQNTYGISNWLVGGGAGTIAQEAVAEVREHANSGEAMGQRSARGRVVKDANFDTIDAGTQSQRQGTGYAVITQEGVDATEASNTETFSPTVQIAGGLGRLPVFDA